MEASQSKNTNRVKSRDQSEKHVFIFGAGASVECGYPQGNDFFRVAHLIRDESLVERSKGGDARWMAKFLSVVEPEMKKLFRNLPEDAKDWPPVEEVLSLAYYLLDKKEISDNFIEALEDMVFYSISGCRGNNYFNSATPEAKKQGLIEKFVKSISTNNDNIFVSMNYDIIIDDALLKSQYDGSVPTVFDYCIPNLRDGFTGRIIPTPKTATKLLKPHGSANLFLCSNCKVIFWMMDLATAMKLNNRLKCPLCKNIDHTRLLVIPPYYGKGELWGVESKSSGRWDEILLQVLSNIRLEIEDAIGRASQITIIGYSFPPYDYDFRFLFLSGLFKNEYLSRSELDVSLVGFSEAGNKQEVEDQYSFLKPIVGNFTSVHANGFCDWIR